MFAVSYMRMLDSLVHVCHTKW